MDKLAPLPREIARMVIAGLLAWTLVMLGFAVAAPARVRVAPVGVVAQDIGLCAEDRERHDSPDRHAPCSCCVLCRSGQIDDAAGFSAELPRRVELSVPTADGVLAEVFAVEEAVSPPGWTSSWSQRAPPRLS